MNKNKWIVVFTEEGRRGWQILRADDARQAKRVVEILKRNTDIETVFRAKVWKD